jgi:hypothetical protein
MVLMPCLKNICCKKELIINKQFRCSSTRDLPKKQISQIRNPRSKNQKSLEAHHLFKLHGLSSAYFNLITSF